MFGPSNSLVLQFDHLTDELADEMESQLDEIAKFYRFVPFSLLFRPGKHRRKMGVAAVVFQNARKSFFLRAVNRLRDRDIVPLIFVRPDIQGTNRLPLPDEWRAYQKDDESFTQLSWENHEAAVAKLKEERQKQGPLPLNTMDPTLFLGTWGNLVELPPTSYEVGLHVPYRPTDPVFLSKEALFLKKQLGKEPQIAFVRHAEEATAKVLKEAGMLGAVSPRAGIVDKSTSAYDIPRFVAVRT